MSSSQNNLRDDKRTARFGRRQGPVRRKTVGASMTLSEQAETLEALESAGFTSASEGAREILLRWVRGQALPPTPVKRAA